MKISSPTFLTFIWNVDVPQIDTFSAIEPKHSTWNTRNFANESREHDKKRRRQKKERDINIYSISKRHRKFYRQLKDAWDGICFFFSPGGKNDWPLKTDGHLI